MLPFVKNWNFSIYKAVILQRGNPKTNKKNPRYFWAVIEAYHLFQGKRDRAVRKQKNDMIYIPSTLAVAQFKLIYKPDEKNMYYTHVYIYWYLYIYKYTFKKKFKTKNKGEQTA